MAEYYKESICLIKKHRIISPDLIRKSLERDFNQIKNPDDQQIIILAVASWGIPLNDIYSQESMLSLRDMRTIKSDIARIRMKSNKWYNMTERCAKELNYISINL